MDTPPDREGSRHDGSPDHERGGGHAQGGGTRARHGAAAHPAGSREHESHDHGGRAHTDHAGHERTFRRRFRVCLVLSVPVISHIQSAYRPF